MSDLQTFHDEYSVCLFFKESSSFYFYYFIYFIAQVAEIHRATCCRASFSIQLRCVHIAIKGLVSWQHSYSCLDRSPIHAEGSSKFSDIRTMSSINTAYPTQLSCAGDEQYRSSKRSHLNKMSVTWVDYFRPVHFHPMVTNFTGVWKALFMVALVIRC